jgi:hypothetical protein
MKWFNTSIISLNALGWVVFTPVPLIIAVVIGLIAAGIAAVGLELYNNAVEAYYKW